MAAQLAAQSELKSIERQRAVARDSRVTHKHLADKAYADKLKAALDARHRPQGAARVRDRRQQRRLARRAWNAASARRRKAQGEAAFRNEPFVRELVERFSATVRPDSIDAAAASRHPIDQAGTVMMKNQLAGLMKQAQQMQENMKRAQEELARTEVEGQSGAGLSRS